MLVIVCNCLCKGYDNTSTRQTHVRDLCDYLYTPVAEHRNHTNMASKESYPEVLQLSSCNTNGLSHLDWVIRMLKDQNPRTPQNTRAIRSRLTTLHMGRGNTFAYMYIQFMEKFLSLRTKLQRLVGYDEYSNGAMLRDYFLPRIPATMAK